MTPFWRLWNAAGLPICNRAILLLTGWWSWLGVARAWDLDEEPYRAAFGCWLQELRTGHSAYCPCLVEVPSP